MEGNGSGRRRNGLRRRERRFLEPDEMNRSLRFFKIILPSSIHEKKLKIPKKFVGMFGQELSTNALLTVPNGGVWQVGLEKSKGQIWFCDGWNKFINFYSIDYGFFLVFKYEGNSSFQVLVFDRTTSEIQYPHDRHGMDQFGDHKVKRSDSITSIPSSFGYSGRSDGKRLYQPHVSKTTYKSLRDIETRNKSKRKSENDPRQNLHSRARTATPSGPDMSIRAATERLKTHNPSFMIIIHQKNIEKSYAYIPSSFATKYLSSKEEIIEIQADSKGQKWKICCRGSGRTSKRMDKGWKMFCKENNLKVGDVVVFELVKRSKNRVMNFTVLS